MLRRWILTCSVLVLLVGQGWATEATASEDASFVGWWKMDETSGAAAADSTGHKFHGTLKGGPKWVKGFEGNALKFDGENDYVALQRAYYNRKGVETVTIAGWVRTDSQADHVVASFDRNEYWRLEINGDAAEAGRVGFSVMTDAGQVDLAGRTRIDDGQWHHIAGVFDNGLIVIYVDGVADATIKSGKTFGTGNRRFGFLGVGSEADVYDGLKGPEYYFAGEMDDVRLYTRALASEEVKELALRGLSNDASENAEPVGEVDKLPFDTREATHDGQGVHIKSPNLWYLYTPSATGLATVSLAGSEFDTMLVVYQDAEPDPDHERVLGFNDDFNGLTSQLSFDADADQAYLIEVGGYDGKTGQGLLTITVEVTIPAEFDLGDAPDSTNASAKRMTAYVDGGQGVIKGHFPTVYDLREGQPRGPVHLDPLAVAHLGPAVTFENEAETGPDEDAVNNLNPTRDEADQDGADDGVVLPLKLPHGEWSSLEYIVSVIEPDQDLWVNIWFDWNRDGDWDDDSTSNPEMVTDNGPISEWAVQNQYLHGLPIGTHKLTAPGFLAWHLDKGPEKVWMRITLSEKPWKGGEHPDAPGNGGSGPLDGYAIGETEDYLVEPESTCALCQDYNSDGQINFDDLIALIYKWLDCCGQ